MLLTSAPLRITTKLIAIATVIALATAPTAALAQEGKLMILRDTETEQLLRDYTRPVPACGGPREAEYPGHDHQRGRLQRFVADGRRIFVNSGALMQSETPNQIIGVLAHETGHLAGGIWRGCASNWPRRRRR